MGGDDDYAEEDEDDEQEEVLAPEVLLAQDTLKRSLATSVVSRQPLASSAFAKGTKAGAALAKCKGRDIVKKGASRKLRYMLVLPGALALNTSSTASGKGSGDASNAKEKEAAPPSTVTIGALRHLDSRNPVLYLDTPQGRLKLQGTKVNTQNRWLNVNLSGRKHAACEDVFHRAIVFSHATFVGTELDNPDERELPLPEELRGVVASSRYASGVGTGHPLDGDAVHQEDDEMEDVANVVDDEDEQDEESEEDGDGEEDEEEKYEKRPTSRQRRASAQAVNLAEDSDDDDDDDDDD
ncbi:DNA-binding protein RHL1 [Pseudoscourfieldia marina]